MNHRKMLLELRGSQGCSVIGVAERKRRNWWMQLRNCEGSVMMDLGAIGGHLTSVSQRGFVGGLSFWGLLGTYADADVAGPCWD